jgi:hypothetical protein
MPNYNPANYNPADDDIPVPGHDKSRAAKLAALIGALTEERDVAAQLALEVWREATPEMRAQVAAAVITQFAKEVSNGFAIKTCADRVIKEEAAAIIATRRDHLVEMIRPKLDQMFEAALEKVDDMVKGMAAEVLANALSEFKLKNPRY